MMKAAIWARVSTEDQDLSNQVRELELYAGRHGYQIVKRYEVEASAFTGRHNPALAQVVADARRGRFDYLLVWALDRLSRQGALATLQIVDRLKRAKCRVISLQEPFTQLPDGMDGMEDIFIAAAAWVARYESERRSERTKAGMAARKAAGKHVGRPRKRVHLNE